MEYIGRRSGVVLNEGLNHGLFGNIWNKRAEEIKNIKEMSRYIEEKTRNNTNTYRAVISFAEDDAVRLGFDDIKAWRELVDRKMPDIADKIGIPISRLEYTAAVHMEKGHPHCHILFWDKKQGVKDPFVHPKVSNALRIDLIKHVFGEEMGELQKIKNEARQAATNSVGGFFDGFLKTFEEMTPKGFMDALDKIKLESDLTDIKLPYSRYPADVVYELAADLLKLRESIPKTGRMSIKLMPPEVKADIYDFVLKMMDKNVDCDREFKKYVHSAMELAKYYSDNPVTHEKAGQTAYDDMLNRLSNAVLKVIKEINTQEYVFKKEIRQEAFRRQMMENLFTDIFGILARSAKSEDNKVQYAHRYGELSKQAKKELAMRLENDTGYDWGER